MKFLVAAWCVLSSADAFAMGITTRESLHAWSKDGGAALLLVQAQGPEGGGSMAWRLLTHDGEDSTYTVSSDFSPGGTSRPEVVSAGECKKKITSLDKALKKAGFINFRTRAKDCDTKTRDLTLQITKRHSEEAQDSFRRARPEGLKLNVGRESRIAVSDLLVLRFDDGRLSEWHGKTADIWSTPRNVMVGEE